MNGYIPQHGSAEKTAFGAFDDLDYENKLDSRQSRRTKERIFAFCSPFSFSRNKKKKGRSKPKSVFAYLLINRIGRMIHENCALLVIELAVHSSIPNQIHNPFLAFVLVQAQSCGQIPKSRAVSSPSQPDANANKKSMACVSTYLISIL